MNKAFLSHSGKDKVNYVNKVVEELTERNVHIDNISFQAGNRIDDEVISALQNSELFVFFISDASLKSEWVTKELAYAKDLLDKRIIKMIFPIIIDSRINYDHPGIPNWLSSEYNIRFIARPIVAARRILQRLIEITWDKEPHIKSIKQLFVGRNELIEKFEQRLSDFELKYPVAIIASGLTSIGRRSLLRHCMVKSGYKRSSYYPPLLLLSYRDSIEDLILKIYDLGFSKQSDFFNLMDETIEKKIYLAVNLLEELNEHDEQLLIIDNGCIVDKNGKVASWFEKILIRLENSNKIIFQIASKNRIVWKNHNKTYYFNFEVPELDKNERKGLLKKYLEIRGVVISNEDFEMILNLLSGYPAQIFYVLDIIKNQGLKYLKDNLYLIPEFDMEKVSEVLNDFHNDGDALDLLQLLADFPFISFEFLLDIVDNNPRFLELIHKFNVMGITEYIGDREYIRLNDIISNFIQRQRKPISNDFRKRIEERSKNQVDNISLEESDLSEYYYALKDNLLSGKQISGSRLIPSIFLNSIIELYQKYGDFLRVIELSERILEKSEFIDTNILREVRYHYCLALARTQNDKFFEIIKTMPEPDHSFLMAFYYRYQGKIADAHDRLRKALSIKPKYKQARREMVQILYILQEYDEALKLAQENYLTDRNNHYQIQAYLRCLIKDKSQNNCKTIDELLNELESIKNDKAQEMFLISKAEYYGFVKSLEVEALEIIEEASKKFPESINSTIIKLEIAIRFGRVDLISEGISQLQSKKNQRPWIRKYLNVIEIHKLAFKGQMSQAIDQIEKLTGYPESYKAKLLKKIKSI